MTHADVEAELRAICTRAASVEAQRQAASDRWNAQMQLERDKYSSGAAVQNQRLAMDKDAQTAQMTHWAEQMQNARDRAAIDAPAGTLLPSGTVGLKPADAGDDKGLSFLRTFPQSPDVLQSLTPDEKRMYQWIREKKAREAGWRRPSVGLTNSWEQFGAE